MTSELTHVPRGMQIVYGGNCLATVPDYMADAFKAGDGLLVVQRTGEVLLVPQAEWRIATRAVDQATDAFARLSTTGDDAVTCFFQEFARRLEGDAVWDRISTANRTDVESSSSRGRSTTRLAASEEMRTAMIEGLRGWATMPPLRGIVDRVQHDGWRIEQVRAPYGVVGFVFEGRPNVLADACGVLRSGNTAVLRIGSDALGTGVAIMEHALRPALSKAGLPEASISLVESREHAAGWALFSDQRLGLAVARGSGPAVLTLGSLANQAGIPVSLHGTGGAWIVADSTASTTALYDAVYHSTDRKVCNSVNVVCLPRTRAAELAKPVLRALEDRGQDLGYAYKLHVVEGSEPYVPPALFERREKMLRAEGEVEETLAATVPPESVGHEWEWEQTPELTLMIVEDTAEAIELFNRYSPRFAASLISEDATAHEAFFKTIDAPFVGNGFTRWVDGQYALDRPELGLSNWQYGRLLGRSGVLSGDCIYTVRLRAIQDRSDIHR